LPFLCHFFNALCEGINDLTFLECRSLLTEVTSVELGQTRSSFRQRNPNNNLVADPAKDGDLLQVNVSKEERRQLSSYRKWAATQLLLQMAHEEKEVINSLPRHEKLMFLTRLEKAMEGDIRYKPPLVQVKEFPGQAGSVAPNVVLELAPDEA
jgi:hypothetical protein